MQSYIPFVTTRDGCKILKDFFADATAAHIKLDRFLSLRADYPKGVPLWLDPGFEGFSIRSAQRSSDWQKYISAFPGQSHFDDPAFLEKPVPRTIHDFVERLLGDCIAHRPTRISIPQWPVDLENPRFKLNRLLVEAAATWRVKRAANVEFVLPVVFTHQSQLATKANRTKVLAHIKACAKCAQFEAVWSVDATLGDQDGTGNFEKDRFPCIAKFFDEMRELLGASKQLTAGPYWGLSLLLWARGKVDHPAIGLGATYQYHLHGRQIPRRANVRVALGPLRRWATYSVELKNWLAQSTAVISPASAAHKSFADLYASFNVYSNENVARRQVAEFYLDWFKSISSNPPAGRALALYQDLSSAYILGKALPPLPRDEKSARRPERVAQQLMLNCL